MADTDIAEPQHSTPPGDGRKRRRNRGLIVLGVVIGVLVLAVLFLPKPVARYIVADQLDKMGIAHEGVDTLDVDIWAQEVRVGPLAFRRSDALPGQIKQFSLKLRLLNLLSRRAVVDPVIIDGVDLKIRRSAEGTISINGIALEDFVAQQTGTTQKAPEEDPWHAALERLQLRDSVVFLEQEGAGNLTVRVDRLDLEGFRTWEPEKPGKFDLDATVNGIAFKWYGEARPFADKITTAIDATVSDLEIAKIEQYMGSLGLERSGGTLNSRFQHDLALYSDGRVDWVTKGTIEIGKADIAAAGQGAIGFDLAQAEVAADVKVGADNGIEMTSVVGLDMRNIRAARLDGQSISVEDLALTVSNAELRMAPTTLALNAAGTTVFKGVSVTILPTGERPAIDVAIGSLEVPLDRFSLSLTAGEPGWQAALSVMLRKLTVRANGGDAADVALANVKVDDMRLDQTLNVAIKALLLGGLSGQITDKIFPPPSQQGAGPAEMNKQEDASERSGGGVRIERLALVDRGELRFVDASVTPSVDVKLAVEKLEIANLDTGKTEQKTGMGAKLKINDFTDVDLSGWATLFASKPDFDLKLALKGLGLPRFSPYMAKAVGTHVDSGQLNLEAKGTGKQAMVDAGLAVNLRNFELGELSPEEAKKLSDAAGMPVQTAIGLLQDSDKTIQLKIPVKGTVTDPEIDLSDAIRKAVGGALTSIFPPTAIASILISASKGGATFAPIPFEEGNAKLDAAGQSTLQKLGELLAKRPKLSLRVCGRATLADVERYKTLILEQEKAMRQNAVEQAAEKAAPEKKTEIGALTLAEILESAKAPMSQLALDRTQAVRRFLLETDETLSGRVSECRSVYDLEDKSPPRADVSL